MFNHSQGGPADIVTHSWGLGYEELSWRNVFTAAWRVVKLEPH